MRLLKRFRAEKEGISAAWAIAGVVLITAIGKLLGFVREALVAYCYGASYVSDIYVLENGIVNAVCTVLLCVVTTAFIPEFMQRKAEGRDPYSLARCAILIFGAISALFSLALFLAPDIVMMLIAPGTLEKYSGKQLDIILLSVRISFFNIYLLSLQGILRALMQVHGRVLLASSQALILNAILILYLLCLSEFNLLGLTVAMIVAQLAISVVFAIRAIRLRMLTWGTIRASDCIQDAKDLFGIALPVMMMSLLSQASYVVDRSVASGFAEGTMALIGYASTLALAVNSLLGESINNVIYPKLARHASEGDEQSFQELGKSVFALSSTVLIPLIVGMAVSSTQVIDVVYGRGSMTSDNVAEAGMYLMLYSLGIYFYYLRDLLNRLCYACLNTRIPSIAAAFGFVVTIICNIVLPLFMGPNGIVVATSIGALSSFCIEITLSQVLKVLSFDKGWIKIAVKVGASTIISIALTVTVFSLVSEWNPLACVSICVVVAFASFCMIAVPALRKNYVSILRGELS